MLDAKIQRKGHKLFIDPSNVMPHRRRPVQTLHEANAELRLHPHGRQQALAEIATWSHTAIGFFRPSWCSPSPPCSTADCPWRRSRPLVHARRDWDLARVAFHIPLGMVSFYIALSWLGAAIGTSPHRSIGTVFLAPLFVFLAQWAYGQGVIKAWREIRRTGGRAGEGAQIDDRVRTA